MPRPTAKALHTRFIQGEVTAVNIAQDTLRKIEWEDPSLSSFLSVHKERVLEKAAHLDLKRKEGKPLGKLAAVPIAIKDNIHIKGELTTCGSKFLSNYKALFNATVVRLMEEEGALLIGKTNLDEFAMGSSTENSAFQITKNPWDLSRSPGGSSGGSAAAVSAGLCPLALGSDTGGSIRQPAAFCGVVGFKPTYGRVSRYGLVAFASSLDQMGPFATTLEDTAYLMEVIGAHCPQDGTSLSLPTPSYTQLLSTPIYGKTLGVPSKFLENLPEDIQKNFAHTLEIYRSLGVKIVDVDLSLFESAIAIYYILATAEASTNLARFDGIRYGNRSREAKTLEEVYSLSRKEGFGAEVKQRILLGTYVLSSGYQDAYYRKAQKVRSLLISQIKKAFETCHMIALPTTPTPAFKLNAVLDPLEMYLQDIYTIPANLAGLPALSLPSGLSKEGLPLSLQLMGPQKEDALLLSFAYAFEQTLNQDFTPPSNGRRS